jgi:REP element-mobilizing transposase RayT/CheY-like chemotaxis protein
MKANLLVATPLDSFGELIRQSLDDTGSFYIHVVKSKAEAILTAEKNSYTLALLDMALGEDDARELGRALRSTNPDIDLVILSDEDLPPAMDSIRPWVLLRKPFYLPDFIQLIRAVPIIPDQVPNPVEINHQKVQAPMQEKTAEPEIPWLNNVSKAAQHLTRLTLESSAQAALITREKDLWAYAGQLSQNAANELAQTVARHWDGQQGNDLLRFVRLEATKAEHMLYATSMTPDIILALVFDAETPFSTIRSQANNLAHSLAVAKTGPVIPVDRSPKPATPPVAGEQAQAGFEADDLDDSSADLEIPSIAEILEDVPPPVPPQRREAPLPVMSAAEQEADETASELDLDLSAAATRPSVPLPKPTHRPSHESSPAIPLRELALAETRQTVTDVSEELASTLPSKSQQRRRAATPLRSPAPGELDETRPHSITEVAGRMIVESASAAMAQLNFACLLVPRFSTHYMTGDLADRLSQWMPQICVAFGWRLEFLAVRPDYLQWVVNVTPNTSPGYLMRIMRQQTSEKIFAEFPRLKKENPSGDFWAPGYLIMGGLQPHPQQLVKDYIKQTRQRQGIFQPQH